MPSLAIIGSRGYPSFYGGFETAVRHLAPYLAEKGWDVTVYGRRSRSRFKSERIGVIQVQYSPGLETRSLSTISYGASATIHASIKKYDAALVLNVANGFFLPFLRVARTPTLVNVDGIEWERAKWGRLAKKMFLAGANMTAKHANQLVFDSENIQRYWTEQFARTGHFIPYGGEDVGELDIENNLTHRGYILFVARFVPENTIDAFLIAAKKLANVYPVVIVGSSGYGGEIEEKVRALSNENNRVSWLGHLNDDKKLHSLWQHAGVYFHGHTVGGTNPALVQAMHCGSPIVARDTVYNREVLGPGGLFVGGNPEEIVDAIMGIMRKSEAQEKQASTNVDRAKTLYSWDSVCSSYDEALRLLIKANH